MTEQEKQETRLPESLVRQLKAFEKRLYRMETVVCACGALIGLFLTYGLLFFSDRLWNTPMLLRGLLTIAGGLAFAWFASWWLRNWWWKRRDARNLARLIQKEYKRLGDRLLGAVELADGKSFAGNISPALCRAAIAQVATEASKMDFARAVPTERPRSYTIIFAVIFILTAIPFILFPDAGRNAMKRWLQPFSQVERYTFVSINDLPSELVVPHGENFEICISVKDESRWRPAAATCRFERQSPISTNISSGRAVFNIHGQTKPGILKISVGDAARDIAIKPVYRPELVSLAADILLPEYLQRTNMTTAIEGGRADILEGCKVRFLGAVSRDLTEAFLEQQATSKLVIAKNRFASPVLPAEKMGKCAFTWKDTFGLRPKQPYFLNVSPIKDEAPVVECRGIARSVAILEDEVVKIEAAAEDDYGLKDLTACWSAGGDKERGTPDIDGSQLLKDGSPHTRSLSAEFSFSPVINHIPEETMVTLMASATDYLPGRKPSTSPVHRIYVLSRARHAKLVQEQMEQMQGRIEDLAREEERILEENKQIKQLKPEDLASGKTAEKIRENESAERENAGKLGRMAREGENLLKEAMRNKDITEENLRRWAELVEKMKQTSEGEMQKAASSLQQAGSSSEQRPGNMEKAIAAETEALNNLKNMSKGLNQTIDDMIAMSFINRLLVIAGSEDNIASTFKLLLPDIVGTRLDDLPEESRNTIITLGKNQDTARKDSKYIQDDLLGFYNRTRLQCYNTIHEQMVEKKTQESLEALAGLIRQNVGAQVIDKAQTWRDQFKEWAGVLAKERENALAQSGIGQDNQLSQKDIEILIALMRTRQREESLREQTRLLEEGKAKNSAYTLDSRKLAGKQTELANETAALERKAEDAELRKLIEKVDGEMMNAAVSLKRPQTDAVTIAIETEIIELLSAIISSNSSQGSGGQGAGAMLALMRAMGMGAATGRTGGGSLAGGTTDKPNSDVGGPVSATPVEGRPTETTGGADTSDWPEEYKELIDAYFNAIEEHK